MLTRLVRRIEKADRIGFDAVKLAIRSHIETVQRRMEGLYQFRFIFALLRSPPLPDAGPLPSNSVPLLLRPRNRVAGLLPAWLAGVGRL